MSYAVRVIFAIILILSCCPQINAATPLTTQLKASGFNSPVFLTAPLSDTTRLFVVERGGRIRIIKDGSINASPFLDISSAVLSGGERGLLGLAFHPEYAANGFFYVNYSNNTGNTVVSRFQVTANPDSADPSSETNVLTQSQPYSNHNGGMIAFSPVDGYLYIGFGDGGAGGDPQNRGQDSTTWLGKMLRIDVDGGAPYAIPPSNPFVGSVTVQREIWALGLRNPWRFSFDRASGDLYIADVGQSEFEEVDFQPVTSGGGENYGWRLKEGSACFNPPTNCEDGVTLVDPIHEYDHSSGRCSITGGYVYRGCAIPDLQGAYFFADYCTGNVWSLRYDGATVSDFTDHTATLGGSFGISSFGQDAKGELYIVNLSSGGVYKIVPDGVPSQCDATGCCIGVRGNIDGLGVEGSEIDISDLVYLVDYMFTGGPEPPCFDEGDVDGSGGIDISDLVYLVDYMFTDGPPPPACTS